MESLCNHWCSIHDHSRRSTKSRPYDCGSSPSTVRWRSRPFGIVDLARQKRIVGRRERLMIRREYGCCLRAGSHGRRPGRLRRLRSGDSRHGRQTRFLLLRRSGRRCGRGGRSGWRDRFFLDPEGYSGRYRNWRCFLHWQIWIMCERYRAHRATAYACHGRYRTWSGCGTDARRRHIPPILGTRCARVNLRLMK